MFANTRTAALRYQCTARNLSLALASALLLGLCLLASPALRAQESFVPNFVNTDISALINVVSRMTGRNFLVDPRVNAKVTVVSENPVSADELYEIFESVLQVHGFAAIEQGGVTKIVPEVTAKQNPIPQFDSLPEARAGSTDSLVTHVFRLLHVSSAQLVPILRPMIPQQGHLAAYAPTNSLIITDRAANISRLEEIIRRIDVPDNDEVEVVRLTHAKASDMVRLLSSIQPQSTVPGEPGGARLAADERSNAILISGDPEARARTQALIRELDTPIERTGNTEVFRLHHANAEDLVEILRGVAAGQSKVGVVAPEQEGGGTASSSSNGEPQVDIQADQKTNSLIITAPADAMFNLSKVIDALDVRRPQVLIEAVIAEVSDNSVRRLGTSFASFDPDFGSPVISSNLGGTFGAIAEAVSNPAAIPDGVTAVLGGSRGDINLGLIVSALNSDTANNILSTPTLVTLDNQEAEIVDGRTVPFISSSSINSDGNPFNTIERQDIGVKLKVTPQISDGNSIKLVIEQELSDTEEVPGAADLATTKRAITTTVLVDDGQTLILGGLLQQQQSDRYDSIPFLSDLPFIGEAFRYRSGNGGRRTLMVFIRPQVIRDVQSGSRLSDDRYAQIREEQMLMRARSTSLLSGQQIMLPEIYVTYQPPAPR